MNRSIWILSFTFAVIGTANAQGNWGDKLFNGNLTHDFGTVARGTQLKYSFPIKNIYKEPLSLSEITVSCGCLTATPSSALSAAM